MTARHARVRKWLRFADQVIAAPSSMFRQARDAAGHLQARPEVSWSCIKVSKANIAGTWQKAMEIKVADVAELVDARDLKSPGATEATHLSDLTWAGNLHEQDGDSAVLSNTPPPLRAGWLPGPSKEWPVHRTLRSLAE
jgi:hypothetical protein